MAGETKAVILNAGKRLITGALTGFSVVGPHSFTVGDLAGFTPDPDDIAVRGTQVFAAEAGLMQARRIADDTARYTLVIPESYGPFNIGNIVMYASMYDNEPEPLVSVVLPFTVAKVVSNPDIGSAQPYPTPGNRFTINITIKHSIDGDSVSVTVQNPNFANLPFYDLESEVPAPAINPYPQFVVHHDTRTNTPVLGAKRADNTTWGVPFWQNLRSPKFGVIDGGNTGDDHKPDNHSWLWGYYYLTAEQYFAGQIGGSNYTDDDNTFGVVGGISYA